MYPNHSTRTTTTSRTYRSGLDEIRDEKRLLDLPGLCHQHANNLLNDENDPSILFDGLPHRRVIDVAMTDPIVRQVVAELEGRYPNYWTRVR